MTRNSSLDDFSGGDGDLDEEAETPTTEDAPVAATQPAVTTYRWSPEGRNCAACSATVQRLWRDGNEFVCPDCKEW
ncbi:DUF7573 domain-containing protein [Haloarchaeobius sp. TZWWS8]|uniref:DUF7573 domain-containing protein n=1 Tax=Haloarchaeobius sp. TZWWS8 TaxID=3446121 RepID=UPI003EBE5586